MTWFKLDDKCAFHSKVLAAGNEAFGVWCRAGSWSSGELLDGFVPEHVALQIGTKKLWGKLETCGGKDRAGLVEKVDGGWRIHDFERYNPKASEVEQKRAELAEKRKKAGELGNAKRWAGHRKSDQLASQVGSQTGRTCDDQDLAPVPSRPDPEGISSRGGERCAPPPPREGQPQAPEPKQAKQRKLPLKPGQPDVGPFWKYWRQEYREAYEFDYTDGQGDGNTMRGIIKHACSVAHEHDAADKELPLAVFEHWVREYLEDPGRDGIFLDNARHPLRHMMGDVQRYGTPWAPGLRKGGERARAREPAIPQHQIIVPAKPLTKAELDASVESMRKFRLEPTDA